MNTSVDKNHDSSDIADIRFYVQGYSYIGMGGIN